MVVTKTQIFGLEIALKRSSICLPKMATGKELNAHFFPAIAMRFAEGLHETMQYPCSTFTSHLLGCDTAVGDLTHK